MHEKVDMIGAKKSRARVRQDGHERAL